MSPNYTVKLVACLQVDVPPFQSPVTKQVFSKTYTMQDLKTVPGLPLAKNFQSLLDTLFSGKCICEHCDWLSKLQQQQNFPATHISKFPQHSQKFASQTTSILSTRPHYNQFSWTTYIDMLRAISQQKPRKIQSQQNNFLQLCQNSKFRIYFKSLNYLNRWPCYVNVWTYWYRQVKTPADTRRSLRKAKSAQI